VQAAVVVDPGLVVVVLVVAEPAADGLGGDFAGPLPVGAVQAGRVGMAAAVAAAAAGALLIRSINDDPETWRVMWRTQVRMGMVPYYMFVERDTGPQNASSPGSHEPAGRPDS
jgi:hypothetical protein